MRTRLSVCAMTMLAILCGLTVSAWGILVLGERVDLTGSSGSGRPLDDHLGDAIGWAVACLTPASAVWLVSSHAARRGRPWLGTVLAAAGLAAWTTASYIARALDQPSLPWPGARPLLPPSDPGAAAVLLHPIAVFPLVLLVALLTVARVTARCERTGPTRPWVPTADQPDVTNRTAKIITAALLALPAAVFLTGGVVAHLSAFDRVLRHVRLVDLLSWDEAVLPLAAAVVLTIAAAMSSGDGPDTVPVLLVGWAATFVPVLSQWGEGGPTGLLIGAFAVLAAMALAWAWRPVALQLQDALGGPGSRAG